MEAVGDTMPGNAIVSAYASIGYILHMHWVKGVKDQQQNICRVPTGMASSTLQTAEFTNAHGMAPKRFALTLQLESGRHLATVSLRQLL